MRFAEILYKGGRIKPGDRVRVKPIYTDPVRKTDPWLMDYMLKATGGLEGLLMSHAIKGYWRVQFERDWYNINEQDIELIKEKEMIKIKPLSCKELSDAGITMKLADELWLKTYYNAFAPGRDGHTSKQDVKIENGKPLSPELIAWLKDHNFLETPDYTKVPEGLMPIEYKPNCQVRDYDNEEWQDAMLIAVDEDVVPFGVLTNYNQQECYRQIRPLEEK